MTEIFFISIYLLNENKQMTKKYKKNNKREMAN